MGENNSRSLWIGIFFLAIIFVSGFIAGWFYTRMIYRDEAVEHGAAHYNQQTGTWEWTDRTKE